MTRLSQQLREKFVELITAAPGDSDVCRLQSQDSVPQVAGFLRECGARLVTVFAEDRTLPEGLFYNYYLFERRPEASYCTVQAPIPAGDPRFASLSGVLPAVNWQEREIQDWFGLEAVGHPNPRRVALHDHWPDVHPLRKDFPIDTVLPRFEGEQHIYRPTLGEGVFQVPVGPVHAGIIEPGHFNFAVAGEPILYLQLRMFYTHKGTEKCFEHVPVAPAVFLAESISGDSSFSHATAFCLAVERAAGIEPPPRANVMRTVLLELERLYNHTGDIGAIATDVGFVIANMHAGRLREGLLAVNEELSGSRLLRGMAAIGGVRRNWSGEQVDFAHNSVEAFRCGFESLITLITSSDSTRDRLERTGILHPEQARALGIVGVAGRASGIDLDVRRDHPYAAYAGMPFHVPLYDAGDVWHRMQVRIDEVYESIRLILEALAALPHGACCASPAAIPEGRCAIGAVEGWRGEIIHWIRTGPGGSIERCKIKDPSVNNWPALVEAVQGNIIADFPVVNKSFNLSYSGTDR
ncbi:MAG TPA: NADH-quinone oxidoreductase subunit C [Bryobacteraceae bacterium]|nr:NADH-quinone oxidoreductase subunit C [Bryobacteraceae bacterium]